MLYPVTQQLTLAQADEQRHLASVLSQIDEQAGNILLSRVATDYPQLFSDPCVATRAANINGQIVMTAQALPNLLNARMAANESTAVAAMRTINTAQIFYSTTYPENGYADTLTKLGPDSSGKLSALHAGLIDKELASGKKTGYAFELSVPNHKSVSLRHLSVGQRSAPISAYQITACPVKLDVTGHYSFYSDQSGDIRRGTGAVLNPETTTPH